MICFILCLCSSAEVHRSTRFVNYALMNTHGDMHCESELLIPLSAIFIWTCRFNLQHTAVTFHRLCTVSLWAQNLPFQKILCSTFVCFFLSDWSHGSKPFPGFICLSVLRFSSFIFCFSYSYVRQTKLASSLFDWLINSLIASGRGSLLTSLQSVYVLCGSDTHLLGCPVFSVHFAHCISDNYRVRSVIWL